MQAIEILDRLRSRAFHQIVDHGKDVKLVTLKLIADLATSASRDPLERQKLTFGFIDGAMPHKTVAAVGFLVRLLDLLKAYALRHARIDASKNSPADRKKVRHEHRINRHSSEFFGMLTDFGQMLVLAHFIREALPFDFTEKEILRGFTPRASGARLGVNDQGG